MSDGFVGKVGTVKVRTPRQRLALAGGVLVAAAVVLVGMASCANDQRERADQARIEQAVADAPRAVVYEMTGDGAYFAMTAKTPDGTVQANPDLPLKVEGGGSFGFSASAGDFVYLSGQATQGRELTCRILVDGEVIAENTSTGKYTVVTCDGTVPARG